MNEEDAKAEAVRYWWDKALESLAAAHRELDAGDYAFAINRAYYALFYAVSALFLEEGRRLGKHSSVRAAFNRDIIKSERLSGEHGKLYNQLFRARDRKVITLCSPNLMPRMSKRKSTRVKNFSRL